MNICKKTHYYVRSNHSSEFACVTLTDHILKQMDNNHIPINIYLDLSKAFDTLDHAILIKKLSIYHMVYPGKRYYFYKVISAIENNM